MFKFINTIKYLIGSKSRSTPNSKLRYGSYDNSTSIIDEVLSVDETRSSQFLSDYVINEVVNSDDSIEIKEKSSKSLRLSHQILISQAKCEEGYYENKESRLWRFLMEHQMNDLTVKISESHRLKYMDTVNKVLNEVYKDYFKKGDYVKLDDINVVLFVDIDNWGRFFKFPDILPKKTYVYCFKGGANLWQPTEKDEAYEMVVKNNMISVCKDIGRTKDAADFALTMHLSKLHCRLPLRIAFLIVSGDYGLCEIVKQMKDSKRLVGFVNPHQKKGNVSDRHYDEKLDDEYHLLDIINIMNYLAIIAKNDQEIKLAEYARLNLFNTENRPLRLSNMTIKENLN